MEKYKRYYGVFTFIAVIILAGFISYQLVFPKITEDKNLEIKIEKQQKLLETKKTEQARVQKRINELKDSISSSVKKIYSPVESSLGNDTLFFTLYNDVIEMIHTNSVKIKSIDYSYNPQTDRFVKDGKDAYFVCDVNMELVSNYVNLGKLIQDLYQYPYYIKINELSVKPYQKDKKILITNLSLRLYARTEPVEDIIDAPLAPMD